MPSKALLRPDEALAEARRIPGAAEAVGRLDAGAVLRRRDEVIHDLDDSVQLPWLEQHQVEAIRGWGRLAGEGTVDVDGTRLTARRAVVVATGSRAALPPIPGLAEANAWTNREATTASDVPSRLLVLGGGAVGVELAQAWSSLGSTVTRVEALPRLLPREEPFAAPQVNEALEARGVQVRVGSRATRVSRNGEIVVELDSGEELQDDELLAAVGRTPRHARARPRDARARAGTAARGQRDAPRPGPRLAVRGRRRERPRTAHPHGQYQARIATDVILGKPARLDQPAHGPLAPRVVFTDPQVAAVGHTLESAEAAGIAARAVDQETSGNAGGSFYGRGAPGTSRLLVDEERRLLVGATFTGADVAEFLHAATIAIVGEVTLDRLWHAVPSFPTRSEVWLRLLEQYGL